GALPAAPDPARLALGRQPERGAHEPAQVSARLPGRLAGPVGRQQRHRRPAERALMSIGRVSDAQSYAFLVARAGRLQVTIDDLQEQIASGKRLQRPEQDGFGAGQAVRLGNDLGALAQYAESSRFGSTVLGAQDQALGDAED